MFTGKLIIMGDMTIDGQPFTGAFVECSKSELKKGASTLFKDVIIDMPPNPTLDLTPDKSRVKRSTE
jgi:hypothetical protein